MRIILLLAAGTVVMQCDEANVAPKIKDFIFVSQNDHESLWRSPPLHSSLHNLFARPTPLQELSRTKEQREEMKAIQENTAANLWDYDRNFNKSSSKNNFNNGFARNLFQCDIFVTEKEAEELFNDVASGYRKKRQVFNGFGNQNRTWYDGVFYTFNTSNVAVRKAFNMGIKVWSDNTCIDFIEDGHAKDKVVVVKTASCFSAIGRRGGDQLLSLSEDQATEGSAVHEIGHVLGLLHTMSRYDRDNFIRIVNNNVDPNSARNLIKSHESFADVYGLSYDYGSIMHYNEISCSIKNQTTMIAMDPHYQKTMGSRMISFSDIFMINEHYGCNAKCNKSTSAKCTNEGFPHPRNCSICICPGGYGGALCDRRPLGCGEDLIATNEKQTVIYSLGFGSAVRDHYSFCNYMVLAPEGKKIEVDVSSISNGYDQPGCPRGGIEIKAQKDQKLTGYRFCSAKGSGVPIVSSLSRLPVILFNKVAVMQVVFTYRFIH